jgi:hypothetical protein
MNCPYCASATTKEQSQKTEVPELRTRPEKLPQSGERDVQNERRAGTMIPFSRFFGVEVGKHSFETTKLSLADCPLRY